MPTESQSCAETNGWLMRLTKNLRDGRYSRCATRDYITAAERFLDYLRRRGLTVHTVKPLDIQVHLETLKRRRKVIPPAPLSRGWRKANRSAIHMLLRLVHEKWPLDPIPHTDRELFHDEILQEFRGRMRDLRGLSDATVHNRGVEAARFLQWIGERGDRGSLHELTISDVDAYIKWRLPSLQRSSKKSVTVNIRGFLAHLHDVGQIRDLARAVIGPKLYALEGIPSALRADEIEKVLDFVRKDRSPVGLRDYAILMLLSTYGLRAGEITALRLDDIDWARDRIRIRHSKTSAYSELPLLDAVGESVLDYLREGRPDSLNRELFLCSKAPYRAIPEGSNLYSQIVNRLKAAGVTPRGKKGPHAFRHARAVGLLRASASLKVIGDVLGHRTTSSTMPYLKLDLEELRGVALDLPGAQP